MINIIDSIQLENRPGFTALWGDKLQPQAFKSKDKVLRMLGEKNKKNAGRCKPSSGRMSVTPSQDSEKGSQSLQA